MKPEHVFCPKKHWCLRCGIDYRHYYEARGRALLLCRFRFIPTRRVRFTNQSGRHTR